MKLSVQTRNPHALERLDAGLESMYRYKSEGALAVLEEAERDLDAAVQADPKFLPAVYYRALAKDLKGQTDAAIRDLEQVLDSDPPFRAEAQFNLGVARFHKYHAENLKEAEREFRSVLATHGLSDELRFRTLASLAQVHAQLMIQRDPASVDLAAVRDRFRQVQKIADQISRAEQVADLEVRWRIENALGLGFMFASDYLEAVDASNGHVLDRLGMIEEALRHFERADVASPKNWAVECNLGSAWMRKAHWLRTAGQSEVAEAAFEESDRHLRRVLEVLRPGYGFVLYEMGRLHRVCGRFNEAQAWFQRALEVPDAQRDVRRETVEREANRAQHGIDAFP
jgi:tetratricopeptide (TPR) repeat protein